MWPDQDCYRTTMLVCGGWWRMNGARRQEAPRAAQTEPRRLSLMRQAGVMGSKDIVDITVASHVASIKDKSFQ